MVEEEPQWERGPTEKKKEPGQESKKEPGQES